MIPHENCCFCNELVKPVRDELSRRTFYNCSNCGRYLITDPAKSKVEKEYQNDKHLLAGYLVNTKGLRTNAVAQSEDDSIQDIVITTDFLVDILSDPIIPKTEIQKLDILLRFLYTQNEQIGHIHTFSLNKYKGFYPYQVYAVNNDEVSAMLEELGRMDYLDVHSANGFVTSAKIVKGGYERIDSLKKQDINNSSIKRQVDNLSRKFNSSYMKAQIDTMYDSIELKPHDAIGKAKELIEDCCKTILSAKGITVEKNWEVPRLTMETCKALKLAPDSVDNAAKAIETIKALLGHHAAIAHSISELRNPYGSGHGKGDGFQGLSPRHARLAVGSASTSVQFMWETYEEQKDVK